MTRPEHQHHHEVGPSGGGTAVLDIGGDVGALVLWTGPERHGQEIEIGPAATLDGQPDRSARTHAAVRERRLAAGTRYGALYVGLRAGRYLIWADGTTPVAEVAIDGGEITEYDWTAG